MTVILSEFLSDVPNSEFEIGCSKMAHRESSIDKWQIIFGVEKEHGSFDAKVTEAVGQIRTRGIRRPDRKPC
jgi:hypothetical protein